MSFSRGELTWQAALVLFFVIKCELQIRWGGKRKKKGGEAPSQVKATLLPQDDVVRGKQQQCCAEESQRDLLPASLGR